MCFMDTVVVSVCFYVMLFWIRATGECGKLLKTSPSSKGVRIGVYIWMLPTIETAGGAALNVATIVVWVSEPPPALGPFLTQMFPQL